MNELPHTKLMHLFTSVLFFLIFIYLFFNLFLATLHGLWDLSSPTRDWTHALGSESTESWPLAHHGIPHICTFLILFLSSYSKRDILPFTYGTVTLKLECRSESPGMLVKIQHSGPYPKFLIQSVWNEAQESAFLSSSKWWWYNWSRDHTWEPLTSPLLLSQEPYTLNYLFLLNICNGSLSTESFHSLPTPTVALSSWS